MNIFTLLKKALNPVPTQGQNFGLYSSRGEAHPGDWQRNREFRGPESLILFPYIFAALSLVSGDIGKLPLRLMERSPDRLWVEIDDPAYSPLLRKPNKFQTRQEFIESWILSVLIHGNAYILKLKDKRGGVVRELRVLDATRVTVLVSDKNEVFYELAGDNLAGISSETVTVPADSIIHHKINTLFHMLVGVSPIRAAAMAAGLGMNIQENASSFFQNASLPGAVLVAPGAISDETAESLKKNFSDHYSGRNSGKIAVLADGLQYVPLSSIPAADAQMIESLGWTGETVCSVFKIPKFKLQIGDLPSYDSVGALSTIYYTDALQHLIEGLEAHLSEGLGLPNHMAVEVDLDGLLRMDLASQTSSLSEAVGGGLLTINEARRALNKPAVDSGDVIFRQEQEWPISQLANRRQGPGDNDNAPGETAKVMNLLRNIKDLAA